MKQYEIKSVSPAGGSNQSYKMTKDEAEAVRLQNIANGKQHLIDERNNEGEHHGVPIAWTMRKLKTKRQGVPRPGNHAYVGGKHGFKAKPVTQPKKDTI